MEPTISKIVEARTALQTDQKNRSFSQSETARLISALTGILAELGVSRNQNVQSTTVTNFPEIQKVVGFVGIDDAPKIESLLTELLQAIEDGKITLPDIQKVEGEITVKNQVVIPPVSIPEYPKQIKTDVTSLPKYVADKLDEVKKAIQSIEVKPQVNVETKASDVTVDLSSVVSSLDEVNASLLALYSKEETEQADLSPVIDGLLAVQKSIESIRFPIPNFLSSWQHSLDMQSKDMPKIYVYTTVATVKVISYLQFVAKDGHTYRKTFSYTSNDPSNPDADTGWIKQDSL